MSQEAANREESEQRSGFPDWLYLVFLLFLFLGPLFNPEAESVDWAVAGVTFVVCAGLYLTGLRHHRLRTVTALALLVVGVVSTWLGTAAMGVVPIYAAALAAGFVTRRVLVWRLGLITLLTLLSMSLSSIPPPFVFLAFGPAIPIIWLIGFSVDIDTDLSRETTSLRA